MTNFTETTVEQAALAWLERLGYQILFGPEIAPGEPLAERESYGQVVLEHLGNNPHGAEVGEFIKLFAGHEALAEDRVLLKHDA